MSALRFGLAYVVGGLVLAGCASGDVPGFSSGNASFGTGAGPAGGTEGDDDGGDDGDDGDGADDGAMTDGASSNPINDDGGDDGVGSSDGGPNDGANCVPSDEICDGIDNDCDLEIDNDVGGADCSTGMPGPCGEGVTACEGGREVCMQLGVAGNESCDGVDNDCDGMVDDGNPEG